MTNCEFLTVITAVHALLKADKTEDALLFLEKLMKEAETKDNDNK